jgi:sortase A
VPDPTSPAPDERSAGQQSTLGRLAAIYRIPLPRRLARNSETAGAKAARSPREVLRRRGVTAVIALLIVGAVGLLGYPFGTNIYQHFKQSSLRGQLAAPSLAVSYLKKDVPIGSGLTDLIAPKIGLDVVVVEGTTTGALRAGAGHYVGTALPCEAGNVAIAGHRTTYGHPFNRLNELGPGDEVELTTPFEDCYYKAVPDADFLPANPHPVSPSEVDVLSVASTTASTLTLTTCDPKGSAAHRLVLRLALEPAKTKILHPLLPNSATTAPTPSSSS